MNYLGIMGSISAGPFIGVGELRALALQYGPQLAPETKSLFFYGNTAQCFLHQQVSSPLYVFLISPCSLFLHYAYRKRSILAYAPIFPYFYADLV
jgi:hypothetical protein